MESHGIICGKTISLPQRTPDLCQDVPCLPEGVLTPG